MDRDVLVARLRAVSDTEEGPVFLRWPDRWWADPHWRCTAGHVGVLVVTSGPLWGDACHVPWCRAPVALTFPEDVSGPLRAPDVWCR